MCVFSVALKFPIPLTFHNFSKSSNEKKQLHVKVLHQGPPDKEGEIEIVLRKKV